MTIKQYKKLARANARANGTSYQAELNAIAGKAGYDSWGPFQKFLASGGVVLPAETQEDEEIADLLDALRFAIGEKDKHLVIRRGGNLEAERAVMERLRSAIKEMGMPTETYRFLDGLSHEEVAMANYQFRTLVAGSAGHPSMVHSGNCVVQDPEQPLSYTNAMASRSDRRMLEHTARFGGLGNGTVSFAPDGVGRTTIRRRHTLRYLPRTGTPTELRRRWAMPAEEKSEELSGYDFVPAFNPLGDEHLARHDWHRVFDTAENISSALILGDDYFALEGRKALSGLITLHVDEAWKGAAVPSLGGVDDMLKDIVKGAETIWANGHDDDADSMRLEIEGRIMGMQAEEETSKVAALLSRVLEAAPRERSGILGTADHALIIFRNPHIRKLTS